MAGIGFNPSPGAIQGAIGSIENLGMTIAGKLFDAEANTEYAQAMNLATTNLNHFYNTIQSDSDWSSYPQKQAEAEKQTQEQINKVLKNSAAKSKFDLSWQSLKADNAKRVDDLTFAVRGNQVIGKAQVTANDYLKQVKSGDLDPETAKGMIKSLYDPLVNSLLVTPEKAESVYKSSGSTIDYYGLDTKAFQVYQAAGSMDAVQEFLTDPKNIPDGITQDQIDQVYNRVNSRAGWGKKDAKDSIAAANSAIKDSIQKEIESHTKPYQDIFNEIDSVSIQDEPGGMQTPQIRKELHTMLDIQANGELDDKLSKSLTQLAAGEIDIADFASLVGGANNEWVGEKATERRDYWSSKLISLSPDKPGKQGKIGYQGGADGTLKGLQKVGETISNSSLDQNGMIAQLYGLLNKSEISSAYFNKELEFVNTLFTAPAGDRNSYQGIANDNIKTVQDNIAAAKAAGKPYVGVSSQVMQKANELLGQMVNQNPGKYSVSDLSKINNENIAWLAKPEISKAIDSSFMLEGQAKPDVSLITSFISNFNKDWTGRTGTKVYQDLKAELNTQLVSMIRNKKKIDLGGYKTGVDKYGNMVFINPDSNGLSYKVTVDKNGKLFLTMGKKDPLSKTGEIVWQTGSNL